MCASLFGKKKRGRIVHMIVLHTCMCERVCVCRLLHMLICGQRGHLSAGHWTLSGLMAASNPLRETLSIVNSAKFSNVCALLCLDFGLVSLIAMCLVVLLVFPQAVPVTGHFILRHCLFIMCIS